MDDRELAEIVGRIREDGLRSYAEIARWVGVSAGRVRRLYEADCRRRRVDPVRRVVWSETDSGERRAVRTPGGRR